MISNTCVAFGVVITALLFIAGGVGHLLWPQLYRPMMPAWLPAHDALIAISGVAELAGGVGLLVRRARRAAAIGLILLLVAVFPANVEMLRIYQARGVPWWADALLWLRLPLQAVLIWWTWKVARLESSRPRLR